MTAVEVMRREGEMAYKEVLDAIEGVSQEQAWARLLPATDDYLHSDGSIFGLVLHIACGKFMYGSAGFRDKEIRWRDLAEQVEAFEPDWARAKEYLAKSQEYWLSTWADLTEEDLEKPVPNFRDQDRPA